MKIQKEILLNDLWDLENGSMISRLYVKIQMDLDWNVVQIVVIQNLFIEGLPLGDTESILEKQQKHEESNKKLKMKK